MTTTWILAEDSAVAGLVQLARGIGDQVAAVVVGPHDLAAAVAAAGVDRCVWHGEPGATPVEAFAGAVADLVAAGEPGAVLAAPRPGARALLGAVAARLGAPALTGVSAVERVGEALLVEREVLGGIARRTERCSGPVCLVAPGGETVAAGTGVPVEETTAAPMGMRIEADHPATGPQVDLGAARRVVAVGRGLRAAEDLPMVDELAEALGGAVACSRPVAEGAGILPKDRYVGVSGRVLAPDLYLALGISGQIQHTVGVRGARTIVAVNTDADAPFFAECDYAVVGDLYQLVPALTEALRA